MPGRTTERRLFLLDTALSNPHPRRGRILSCRLDGSDLRTVVDNLHEMPDGIAIDHENGHVYWTNMGVDFGSQNGSIQRCKLDGTEITTIVPRGVTCTPKQLTLAQRTSKIYWCDREGMRVMRCNLDGSQVETVVTTGDSDRDREDRSRWCVGIAIDEERDYLYWSQKGPAKGNVGCIFRAPLATTQSYPIDQRDIEVVFKDLPEPIDLELEVASQTIYWTDRGDPPMGNSLNRAFVGVSNKDRGSDETVQPEILATRLHEAIGLAVDFESRLAYVTDLSGGVYRIDLTKGKASKEVIFAELGDLTGLALVDVPAAR